MVDTTKTVDLLSLIEQRAPVRFKRAASTGGGEYHGNCPWCAGRDRFHCWPHADFPRYWCRGCQAKGDAIDFLRQYEGLSFRDACQELGIEPEYANSYKGTSTPLGTNPAPCSAWQDAAEDFIYAAMKALHGSSAPAVAYRDYLLARRITVATMLNKKIGYVPLKDGRWIETPFTRWGLTEDMLTADQWQKGCVRVPDGLLFPHFGPDGRPWKLAMYRPLAEQLPQFKRGMIAGSKECLLNENLITQEKPVMMVESFLDAISVEQVAGDLVTPVSTDGTKGCRSLRLQAAIQVAPYALQSFDADQAGNGDAEWWYQTIENCIRHSPRLKDANEMLVDDPASVRRWVERGIERATSNNALRRPSDGPPVDNSSSTVEIESTEVAPVCALCPGIAEHYTDQGTPCCEKHFQGQQRIEQELARLAEETIEKPPSTDPLTAFAQMVDKIGDIFAPCTVVKHDPGYSLRQHVDFLISEEKRVQIAKQVAMSRMVRDRQYARLHSEE